MVTYVRMMEADDLTHHRPQHVYESTVTCPLYGHDEDTGGDEVICQLTTNTNESALWCEECGQQSEWTRLKKSFVAQNVSFPRVWQSIDIPNPATGQVESDPRKFREHLHVASEQMAERLGMKVDYQPVDMTDKDSLGVTDEGLDATHDRAVADGRKDSRGRFVW